MSKKLDMLMFKTAFRMCKYAKRSFTRFTYPNLLLLLLTIDQPKVCALTAV